MVPVFCLDDRLWAPAGDNRRAFLAGCLRDLDDAIGGHLVVRHGDPVQRVPALAEEVEADEVLVTADFAPTAPSGTTEVEAALAASRAGPP